MTHFEEETALTRVADGRWTGTLSHHWGIGDNPNGGYLVAVALQALRGLSPAHPDPLTVTTHYLRPGLSRQPCEVITEIVRSGRTMTTCKATLIQEGKARVEVMAAFGDLSVAVSDDLALSIDPPDIPAPEQCLKRSADDQGIPLPILDRVDIRLHPSEARPGQSGRAQVTGWIRFRDEQLPDSCSIVLFTDAFPPSLFGILGAVGWVPTLELTVHVRRRPAPGWVLGQCRVLDLADGRFIEDGLLWDSEGQLIAQSRQLGLVLTRPD